MIRRNISTPIFSLPKYWFLLLFPIFSSNCDILSPSDDDMQTTSEKEPPASNTTNLESGLIAYYTFENNLDNVEGNTDFNGVSSGTNYDLDSPSGSGNSLKFSPSLESHLIIGRNPLYNLSEASFSFWIKTPSPNSTQCVIHGDDLLSKRGFNFILNGNSNYDPFGVIFNEPYVYTNGRINWNYGQNNTFTIPINEMIGGNEWHLVAFTTRAGEQILYVDDLDFSRENSLGLEGVDQDNGLVFGQYVSSSRVGTTDNLSEFFLNAKIDNIRIYERVLTKEEVELIYEKKL